ncbi:initiation factor, subunit 2 family protein [Ostertagia ostertagi]
MSWETASPDNDKDIRINFTNQSFNNHQYNVYNLTLSISKLTEGIQKMGEVLGAVKLEATAISGYEDAKSTIITASATKEYTTSKQKSAEEVKAQRANKAAEKKARAEAAAAKKAAEGGQGKVQHSKNNELSKQDRAIKRINKALKAQNDANDDTSQTQVARVGKSALRGDGKHQPVREVKFDLTANTMASPSEESVCSDVPVGPCSECPEPPSTAHIHPAFLNLAVRCELGMIDEVDSLCLNFLGAFKQYLADWVAQRQKENRDSSSLGHDLDLAIRPQIAYLTQESRWPLPYALGNIVRQLKKEIMKMGTSDRSGNLLGIESVKKWLDDCEEEYFGSAYRAISDYLLGKMKTSPNVITYEWCPVVNRVLLDAVEKDFDAIFTVIDPEMEGKGLRHIQSFIERKIRCRYTDLNSVGAVMKSGSMVLLGCAAVLSNGCVVAPKGSMLVALTAKAYNVPVLILSQTFKFVDKVQGGGRVALLNRESMELIPSDLITAIVTDIRVLPPSSAPAVLKAKALDLE